jgi:hypothetical protein
LVYGNYHRIIINSFPLSEEHPSLSNEILTLMLPAMGSTHQKGKGLHWPLINVGRWVEQLSQEAG